MSRVISSPDALTAGEISAVPAAAAATWGMRIWRTIARTLLVAGCLLYAPGYYVALTNHDRVSDFFQEWASAKNYFEGIPLYTPQAVTAWKYLHYRHVSQDGVFVNINAHPPASVLFGLPFALLPYSQAFLLWNLLSLGALATAIFIIVRMEASDVGVLRLLPPLIAVLGNGTLQHLAMGQWGALLLLLLIGVVAAEQRGRASTAGVLLGTAVAVKIFPVVLFLYFVAYRRWRTVAVGAAACILWNAAAAVVFGSATYVDYVHTAMPEALRYRDWWANYSITGFWFKLFDGASGQTSSLVQATAVARIGAFVCTAVLIALSVRACRRAASRKEMRRGAPALTLVATILASPIVWDHYFVLLTWPLVQLAVRLPSRRTVRALYGAALFFVWLNPLVLWVYGTEPQRPTTPWEVVAVISWPFYALLTIYGLCWWQLVRDCRDADGEIGDGTE